MPQHVGRNDLAAERGACRLGGLGVPGDEQLDCVAAERLAAAGREDRAARLAATLIQPGAERPGDLGGDRGAAFFAALARTPDVRSGTEVDVSTGERGELGNPQP